MAYDASMRKRFDRVSGGEFRADDLRMLFMYFRQVASHRLVVREVAHFMSHPDKRDVGLMPDLMFDVFAIAQFQLSRIAAKTPIDVANLPPHFIHILRGARRQLKTKYLKTQTGLNSGGINRTLATLEAAFGQDSDGRMYQARELEAKEFELFKALLSVVPINTAFSQEDLCKDFGDAAKSVDFLRRAEDLPRHISPWLMLVAIEAMHHVKLVKAPFHTTLELTVYPEGYLTMISTLHGVPPHMDVKIGMPIVTTTMRPVDWCVGAGPVHARFAAGVEATLDAKLRPLE